MASEVRQTLDDIFHVACGMAPEKRAVYLDSACEGNPQLRHELEDLLEHYEPADTFLEKNVLHDAARQLAKEFTPPASHSDTLPQSEWMIGPYRIMDEIGKGGMGVVYLADDTLHERYVAIKVLPRDYLWDEDRLARFNREARVLEDLKHLKHPNIAEIYEQTEHHGKPCLVLEYVPGDTLADRLEKGPLPIAEALRIALQITDALDSAHRQHIVHRDLKPANIKVTPEGKVKVLDFGLAKRIYPDLTEESAGEFDTRSLSLTESGMLIGTPAFMSPEQWDGKEIDQRTDLWAFGCLLFEMLSGQSPFARKTRAETMNVVLNEPPDWQDLPQDTPIIIQDLLRKCLQKNVNLRLQDASEARQAITEAMGKKFAPLLLVKSQIWRVKRHARAITVAAALALCAAAVVWYWLKITEIPEVKSVVMLPFKGFNTDQAGVGFAEDLRKSLVNVSTDIHIFKPPEDSENLLSTADLGQTFVNLGVNLAISGDVRFTGDRVEINYWVQNSHRYQVMKGKVEGPVKELPALMDRAANDVADQLKLSPSNRVAPAARLNLSGKGAADQYLEAIGLLQSDLTPSTVDRPILLLTNLIKTEGDSARLHAALAQAYLRKYLINEETELLSKAFEACERALQLDPQATEAQVARGLALTYLENYPEAINSFNQALERNPDDLEALLGLAGAFHLANRYEEAEEKYQEAVKRWPNYWGSHNELGGYYYDRGKYLDALDKWLTVIRLNPDSRAGYINAGNAYLKLGKYEKAIDAYNLSLEKEKTEEGYIGLGTVQFYLQEYTAAADSFKAAIKMNRKSALLWANLGDAQRQIPGEEQEAIKAYSEAIDIRLKRTPEARNMARLAELYAKRSTLRMGDEQRPVNDVGKALYLISTALHRDSGKVEIIADAITVYHLAGDRVRALYFVDQALKNGYSLAELQSNPEIKELRLDPRFQTIISKYSQ